VCARERSIGRCKSINDVKQKKKTIFVREKERKSGVATPDSSLHGPKVAKNETGRNESLRANTWDSKPGYSRFQDFILINEKGI